MSNKKIASECGTEFFAQNSIAGFKHSLGLNVDGIEFDVHLSRDNEVVVQHDYRLNKNITRDSSGEWLTHTGAALCDLTREQLKQHDIGRYLPGSPEAKAYPNYQPVDGAPIPLLSDFTALLSQSGKSTELWVELKTSPFDRATSSEPQRLLDQVLNQLAISNLAGQTVLLAFEWDLLVSAKAQMPELQTNFLTINEATLQLLNKRYGTVDAGLLYGQFHPRDYEDNFPKAIASANGDYWGPWIQDVSEEDIVQAKAAKVMVNLWGVDGEKAAIDAAKALGAEAITTSNPTLI
jgi:glycerophosphoryl diester phosphodiesterase